LVVVKGNDGTTSGITPDKKYGVWGDSKDNYGIIGTSGGAGVAVRAESQYGFGVEATGIDNGMIGKGGHVGVTGIGNLAGVSGSGTAGGYGVVGESDDDDGVGVYGFGKSFYGVMGTGGWTGVFAENLGSSFKAYLGAPSVAGDFYDNIYVHGKATVEGGIFQIDHPLDPGNKYLSHSFVNSADMKNIYDGIAILDIDGKAKVELPEWFETINKDFRYQLTAIGSPGSNLYIEEEITKNHFKIAGGTQGMKVSWQVTGIRKDPWANANRFKVEEEKPDNERDYYLRPELYNKSAEWSIEHARYPGHKERLKKMQDMANKRKSKAKAMIDKVRMIKTKKDKNNHLSISTHNKRTHI
jgi:hypothetical protein